MDNEIIAQIGEMGGLFNLSKITLILLGLFILVMINKAVRDLSQKLMDKLPSRRFLILQLATLFSFIWYIGGVFRLLLV